MPSHAETGEPTWERARRPEQIEIRRRSILDSATRLLDEGGVEAASLSAIASAAGLSKANLYRYYESREAILFELLLEEMRLWIADFEKRLGELRGHDDFAAVAQALADSVEARPRYGALMSVHAIELERNLGPESIRRFKGELRDGLVSLIAPLAASLPRFSRAQANEFLVMHSIFQMGLWPLANPAPPVVEALDRPGLSDMRMDFAERVRWHAFVVLLGLDGVESPRVRPE